MKKYWTEREFLDKRPVKRTGSFHEERGRRREKEEVTKLSAIVPVV